jgi:cytochrome c-type biogenesis protein CcmE
MRAARRQKLNILLVISGILALAVALILYALRQNISLFYTPSQVHQGQVPKAQRVRIGGMVQKGSLHRSGQGLEVHFVITDTKQSVEVLYSGILPDLFREGQGVVVEGELRNTKQFQAKQVLAKHDANYMPPEVKASLAHEKVTS